VVGLPLGDQFVEARLFVIPSLVTAPMARAVEAYAADSVVAQVQSLI
jgi:hypothetical protein